VTDAETGETELVASLGEMVRELDVDCETRWGPDGERLLFALRYWPDESLRLTTVDPDGGGWEPLFETLEGSGHPIRHPDGHTMVTDAYLHEDVAFDDGTVPLRVLDPEAETERTPLRIPSEPDFSGPSNMLRVDPLPPGGRLTGSWPSTPVRTGSAASTSPTSTSSSASDSDYWAAQGPFGSTVFAGAGFIPPGTYRAVCRPSRTSSS